MSDGKSPLHRACEEGKEAECRKLLLQKCDPNLPQPSDLQTPLFYACKAGTAECVKMLVLSKANVDSVTKAGLSPLFVASQKGHRACVDQLLAAKAAVNLPAQSGKTPLIVACEGGFEEIAKCALQRSFAPPARKHRSSNLTCPSQAAHQQGSGSRLSGTR